MNESLQGSRDAVVALIPMKPLHLAKSRLSTRLHSGHRAALALGMFAGVVKAAFNSKVAEIWVVGGDFKASERSRYPGIRWLDDPGLGLNDALSEAMKLADDAGFASLYLPADLPFLKSGDIDAMVETSEGGAKLAFAPAQSDGGTNAMLVPASSGFRPLLGEDSFRRHQQVAGDMGIPYGLCNSSGFDLDLDTPTDLTRCEEIQPGVIETLMGSFDMLANPEENSMLGLPGND